MKPLSRKFWKALRLLRCRRWRQGLRHGVAAAIEHRDALRSYRFATIVDVGANVGQFSLFCREIMPEAKITAFEPLPDPAARFDRLFRNDSMTKLFKLAIGPHPGQASMHVSKRQDSSSLLPIGSAQVAHFPGTEERCQLDVEVVPLDTVLTVSDLAAPALLKLDVQGYELQALEGCASLLKEFANVYVECSFVELYDGQALAHDVVEFLGGHQFEPVGQHNAIHAPGGRLVQADLLFRSVARTEGPAVQ